MTTPDATRCPGCSAPLPGIGSCPACGLRLRGPEAARLWEVDTELLRLDAARRGLLAERDTLVAALRAEPVHVPAAAPAAVVAAPRAEWTAKRTSNTLLGLGGLLLAVAAVVFAAVTYERLGAGGRAAVLLTLTVVAGLAVPRARLRGLVSTAETLTAVTLALAALDAYGLRTLGLAETASDERYVAGSAAVLALLSAGYATLVPVRLARIATVVLAQLPVPVLLLEAHASGATTALWLTALAAVDLAALAVLTGRGWARPDVVATLTGAGAAVTAIAGIAAVGAALGTEPRPGAVALLCLAAVVAGASVLVRDPGARLLLSAVPVGAVALAAHAVARPELSDAQSPLVPVAVALLAVQAASLLPRPLRTGPVLGALAVAGASVLAVAQHAVVAALAPLTWLGNRWQLPDGASARAALADGLLWEGTLVTPVVLAAAATAAVGAGLALHRTEAAMPAGVLLLAAVVTLPVGLDLSHAAAVALLVALGAAAALAPRPVALDLPLSAAGTGLLALAAAWSVADRETTLAVLPAVAMLLAAVTARTRTPVLQTVSAGLATLVAAGEVAAIGVASGLATDQVGGLLVVAVALLSLAATPGLGADRRTGVEVAAVLVAMAAAGAAAPDAGWLSWVLAGLALVALGTALRPDRRRLAIAGGLLLSASSWVRLAAAGVTDPEPYVVPLAVAALVLGHLRRRRDPGTRSFPAYGPGLGALLVPSLLASYAGSPLWRPLILAAVCVVVVLLGARERLQAPLAIGGTVLALDAALLLAPYAAAAPRWLVLGAAGALLLAVGATYEQRLRELSRLRDRYESLI